ncbi:related to serine/threonine-protein kinase [Melanopsichium pennsylvanicum]|uniref:Related to serine/threonine-protein kinase n=2 Tax=Melanopsichium pennsylvanicum TaxID=63383 RepID=A0AAJ4XHD1_9BASI|nr:related to serine/threonine-protein kinase [Melanopsichium pennsylvanicum 4]SNX82327.1 related to serine/threonine-protein kinase [Melanopsichium pennsylvanicum]
MPLEQIRPVAALNSSESLRRASYFDYPTSSSASNSPFSRDETGSDFDRENMDGDGDDANERYKRYSSSSRNSESMSLAKLGGVGGVTRSGSWGRSSLPENSHSSRPAGEEGRPSLFKPLRSSLARYREEPEEHDLNLVESTHSTTSLGHASTLATAGVPHRPSSDGDSVLASSPSRCIPSAATLADQPTSIAPGSSRTSTASSAAAFSLRSLSNRNSTGSVSSLASSVVSRGELDRLTPAPLVESPAAFYATSAGKSNPDSTLTGSSSSSSTALSSPSRHHAADAAQEDDDHSAHKDDGSDAPSQDTAELTSSSADPMSSRVSGDSTAVVASRTPTDMEFSADAGAEGTSLLSSPAQILNSPPTRLRQPIGSPTSESGLQPSAEELLSSSGTNTYSPLVPRRHSGMIMLRSRSQLALHPGLTMTFASADGGRAAARERARKQTGWENAPFSVLEAQRHARSFAYSQPASPGASGTSVAWDASTPTSLLQPAASVNELAAVRSPKISSRPLEHTALSPQSSPSLQPPTSNSEAVGSTQRPAHLARQKSEHTLSCAALARLDTVLGYYGNDAPEQMLPASADAATTAMSASGRPQPIRSPSGSVILGSNSLLRTPTTEEWSRYLESQGVGLTGRRSRTGTDLSSSSSVQRGSRLALSGMHSTLKPDQDPAAADYDEDSDMDSDGSEDHDIGVEVLEKLRQLGLSRAASRAGSALGDELASLHEEDEDNLSPVSPQVDKILPQADLTPLTPLASGTKALPSQCTSFTKPNSSPSTPQAGIDRGTTIRLPRSKRPTVSSDIQGSGQLYSHDFNGEKSINDFEIVSDIGRGAYGLVKKARRKGPDGRPQGEEVVIKYIIKSRILADCWRRHRVLGPIPVEIHVMDQLRRIAYVTPTKPRPWAPKRPKTLEEYRARKRLDAERSEALVQVVSPTAAVTPSSHPNICRMLDFFEDHEFYYLVMPCFGRGQDLFDYVESAPDGLAASQCRSIFGQVADALWFLHANNIVHRDIKDENVILDGEGNAQLIDFGSAAHVRPGKLFDTFSGTLDYAAAEILQGEKYAGQAQDVWALGVVGFVLLCGECPFWNGEEAVQGLEEGTRAAQTLKERCMIARGGPTDPDKDLEDQDLDMAPLDPAWSPCKDREGAEPDGGGRVDDFVDLISRCLELDPESRPLAEQICQHRFLAGHAGWTGRRGWQHLKAPIVSSCTTASEAKSSASAPPAAIFSTWLRGQIQ